MKCVTDDCTNEAKPRGTHCSRCYEYQRRTGRMPSGRPRTWGDPWATLMAAVKAWAEYGSETDADEAFARTSGMSRAQNRVRIAAIRYAQSLGYEKAQAKQHGEALSRAQCGTSHEE